MDVSRLLDRIEAAVSLDSDDAAIRMTARYEPQAGPSAKVFPPTYLEREGTRYHLEERWDEEGETRTVVILDSVQSQANRAELALQQEAGQLGPPQMVLEAQLEDMMGDAPVCDGCGHITVRNGACYKCLICGNSMGCS